MAKKPDPVALLAKSKKMHDEAEAIEAEAIREALKQSDWLVARAAATLGMGTSSLQRLLEPGRRHEAIGREAREHRTADGYQTGRPPTK
jgi:transcriptional regulator with GAF, ATPase, and Fis domain